jgi:hypothetical protein
MVVGIENLPKNALRIADSTVKHPLPAASLPSSDELGTNAMRGIVIQPGISDSNSDFLNRTVSAPTTCLPCLDSAKTVNSRRPSE